MTGTENFLEHNFHDSFLKGAEREDRDVILIIDTDIHWFPGRPITLLKLVYADSISEVQELAALQDFNHSTILEAKIIREKDRPFNFKLEMQMASDLTLECKCYNFWTDRVEEYKDYRTTSHT